MKRISKKYPLIVEAHPENYEGYKFITLIRYNDDNFLTIVDNSNKKFIDCYVLDLCKTTNVKEEYVIEVTQEWYDNSRTAYPVSIEFSKKGLTPQFSKILKRFSVDYVTRVIGPLPYFNMKGATKVRKRKRKPVPEGIRIVQKKLRNQTL
jgi:hypothetical protein